MKKIVLSFLAVAALAACANEDVIGTHNQVAIQFGEAFVNNSTKVIYEKADDITGFTVWGNVQGTGINTPVALYGESGAAVTRNSADLGAAWTCDVTRYWTPSCDYNFVAIANGTANEVVNGVPTKIAYTVNTTEPADLIYGATTAKTDANSTPTSGVNDKEVVAFTMQHLLSRVKVSFNNTVDVEKYTYAVTNVKINTWKSGIYTIGETTPWAQNGSDTATIECSTISSLAAKTTTSVGDLLVIPGSAVELVFTYEAKLNGTTYKTETITKSAVVTPAQNYSYNITVQFTAGNKIEFTIDKTSGLTDFTEGSNVTVQ